jgi:hypothetical protein
MEEDNLRKELLKRKFGPISGWRPATQRADLAQTLKSVFGDTVEQAQKRREALEKALGPLAGEASARIRDLASFLEEKAEKSSKEARSFLAKTLEAMAERLKP